MEGSSSIAKKISLAGVFAALVMFFTLMPRLPVATGYIHLGDAVIFVACVYIGFYAIPAAAIGSCLADLVGYPQYVLPTLVIKSLMALIAVLIIGKGLPSSKGLFRISIAFIVSSLFMQCGYVLTDYILAGVGGGTYVFVTIKFLIGLLQTVVCVPLGVIATRLLLGVYPKINKGNDG